MRGGLGKYAAKNRHLTITSINFSLTVLSQIMLVMYSTSIKTFKNIC